MNNSGLRWLWIAMAILVVLVGISVVHRMGQSKRYATTMLTHTVGRQLIETTNSSLLILINPDLRAKLSMLLASTTHIARVRLGDEPRPLGDGHASSTVVLTNELAQGVGLRLRWQHESKAESSFEVLGFWTINESNGPHLRQ